MRATLSVVQLPLIDDPRLTRRRLMVYLLDHPRCEAPVELEGSSAVPAGRTVPCGRRSTVRQHWPRSHAELVAAGVDDPDRAEYCRPVCSTHSELER